jgi:hypothetical protein
MDPNLKPYARQAESTIRSTWSEVAKEFTLGWGGPLEAYEERFPFVSDRVRDIRHRVSFGLPLLSYQTRESPPENMVVAIPYEDRGGRYNCRLLSHAPISPAAVRVLNDFSQAFWFLLDCGILPSPQAPGVLEQRLVEWTGRELLEL